MYKPKILVLGLAIAISIFSLAYTNLAIAQTEQTEGFTAALSGGEEVPPVDYYCYWCCVIYCDGRGISKI